MKKTSEFTTILLLISIVMLVLSACAKTNNSSSSSAGGDIVSGTEGTNGSEETAVVYPIQTDKTLNYWLQSPTTLKPSISEVPFYLEWQKRVGVPIKFSEVSTAQAQESFSTLLSSGNLPDIIEYNWLKGAPGGPEKALQDGYILRLNDLIDKHAPNLKKYLQEHPDVDRLIKTDDGDYYAFPFIKEVGGRTTQWAGPTLRKDWLEELGLEIPTTIDEWYTVLKAFKEKKGVKAPLTIVSQPKALQGFLDGAFVGAFGVIRDFYIDDAGKVQYGPLQPGYKEFLATMNHWYKEGLLDQNFTQTDRKTLDAAMTAGLSGATTTSAANIDKWELTLTANDPNAKYVFAPYPVLKKGDKPQFGQEAWAYPADASAAVSAKSKNPELAVQVLDYAYSDEGYLLFNYGTENESYKLDGTKPELTDLIRNNPDKLSYVEALQLYTHAVNTGPYIQSRDLINGLSTTNEDHNFDRWITDNLKHVLPPVTIAASDASEFARIINDVNTLVDETSLKIILGTDPVDSYDSYVDKLKSLNIQRAIDIQQAAYDRFQKR